MLLSNQGSAYRSDRILSSAAWAPISQRPPASPLPRFFFIFFLAFIAEPSIALRRNPQFHIFTCRVCVIIYLSSMAGFIVLFRHKLSALYTIAEIITLFSAIIFSGERDNFQQKNMTSKKTDKAGHGGTA
jgi:hypothetical protein